CLEADDAPARVGDREEQPALEVVVAAAIDQPRAGQLLLHEPTLRGLARERRPARREAEPVFAADVFAEAPTRKVGPRIGAGLRLPEVALVERSRRVKHCVEAVASPSPGVLFRGSLLVLERHVEALREPFDCADEVDAFGLLDERDRVTGGAAAEAVVEPFLGANGERRRPLVVEGTEPG